MGNHRVCCLHRDTPTPTPNIRPIVPELKLPIFLESNPIVFSSARVDHTQEYQNILPTLHSQRVRSSPKQNKSEVSFPSIYRKDSEHARSFQHSPKKRKMDSLPLRDFNQYEGAMQRIEEFKFNTPQIKRSTDRHSKSILNPIGIFLIKENGSPKDLSPVVTILKRSNSTGIITKNCNNEIHELITKIRQLTTQLKTIPHGKKRQTTLPSSIEEYHSLAKTQTLSPTLEFEECSLNQPKQVVIEHLNNNEDMNSLYEENYEETCLQSYNFQSSYTPKNVPLQQKYITYTNEFEEDEYREVKIQKSMKEMRNQATDTNDLEIKEKEKVKNSMASIDMQTQETEPNNEETIKIKTPPKIETPKKLQKKNTSKSWGKKSPLVLKADPKLKNMLQDLNKLKKLGFTFILKFTDNNKPQVKVGGGYVSLEIFLRDILEKISKLNHSPKNCDAVDPELVTRLNDYLTDMNNMNLQKAEASRRESFQGRWNSIGAGKISSPRGNFLKAVVEKETTGNQGFLMRGGSMSPGLDSKRSLHLTEDFTINVISGGGPSKK